TLRASFRSLVVLGGSKTDPETAEEMSKALGEHEVARPEYTDSRNPGSSRNTREVWKRLDLCGRHHALRRADHALTGIAR
ncbi:TraG/TraD/VirD4 family protein, partial [Paenibacillus polymyxa]|nr:TraG/TraD/VirD4 family protein [Paenibacillus polymyxa]